MTPEPTTAAACYDAVNNKGCSSYIHMDDFATYGISGGSTTLEECAAAVKSYDGQDGCLGDYFFYEDGGYCNCPVDACTEASENGNAGGSGQLYEFTACMHPTDAYEICSVEACHDDVSSGGECCTGGWCDAGAGLCYTDDGCKYAYSADYTHQRRARRLGASLDASRRRLFDRCDDAAFAACMATKTGQYFDDDDGQCTDHSHYYYYSNMYYNYYYWNDYWNNDGRCYSQAWFAISDSGEEGTWVCSTTGEAITYSNWEDGEPNDCCGGYTCPDSPAQDPGIEWGCHTSSSSEPADVFEGGYTLFLNEDNGGLQKVWYTLQFSEDVTVTSVTCKYDAGATGES